MYENNVKETFQPLAFAICGTTWIIEPFGQHCIEISLERGKDLIKLLNC